MFDFSFKARLLSILVVILFISCGDKDPQPADVSIDIKTYVKTDEAVKDDIKYTTAVGHTYSLTKLVYYLTDINLVAEDGTNIEIKESHLRNIDEPSTEQITGSDIPAGDYTALTFTFGLKRSDNITSFLENTVANQNMYWPDMLGPGAYHYMKFEGQYKVGGTGEQKGFAFHLGPTSGEDYSIAVIQPISLNIDGDNKHLTIKMDLDKWFHDTTDWDFESWTGGIMNKPAAQVIAFDNGQNVFSVNVD